VSIRPEDRSSLVRDTDRNTAVRRVQEAYTEGYISYEEMDRRLHQVLTATTRHEIASALASLPAEDPGTTSTISAAAGRIQRRGEWRVPRTLKVQSAFGRVQLDLSRAVLGTGGAKITVPRDAIVDLEGLRTGWRDSHYTPRRQPRPGGPTIRISGIMGFGRLRIRHAWR
jgi:hypothetical protein